MCTSQMSEIACTRLLIGMKYIHRFFKVFEKDLNGIVVYTYKYRVPQTSDTGIFFRKLWIEHAFTFSERIKNEEEYNNLYEKTKQGYCPTCGHVKNCRQFFGQFEDNPKGIE